MTEPATARGSRLPLILGVGALVGGLWLFLNALGVGVPPFKRLWPLLFVLAGVASLVDWLALSKRASSAGWALVFIGLGVLGFAFTVGNVDWRRPLDWLPAFPTVIGAGLIATWLADARRSQNNVVAGVVLLGLGALGFGARFDWLARILPSAQVVWALLLLVGGGYLIWRFVSRSRE